MTIRETLRSLDWLLVAAAVLLMIISLAMLFSSTYTSASWLSGRFGRQSIAIGIGAIVFLVMARVPYHSIQRYTVWIYGAGVAGLLFVAGVAQVIRGAASRLAFGGWQLQPSEFMKIAAILMLALALRTARHLSFKSVMRSVLLVGIPVLLIALEPDIGVAFLLIAVWGIVLLFLGLPWPAIAGFSLLGLLGSVAVWQWVLLDYQKNRLLTFLDPTRDPLGTGYNVVQSIVALGSGRLFGRGLGHGPQSQLQFLPERHTDFILASIGEELGFIGVAAVILLYGLLLWRILRTAQQTPDRFGQIICVGTFALLLVSLLVSAGMNMGLLPVTGIPLPLVSYGGSNLLSTLILLGMVQSVRIRSHWLKPLPGELDYLG